MKRLMVFRQEWSAAWPAAVQTGMELCGQKRQSMSCPAKVSGHAPISSEIAQGHHLLQVGVDVLDVHGQRLLQLLQRCLPLPQLRQSPSQLNPASATTLQHRSLEDAGS